MQKQRILSYDFIRAISALGIIGHHICRELQARKVNMDIAILGDYATGNFGWLFVTLFFILSGSMLYLNYSVIPKESLKQYYFKRWKNLLPMFYLTWSYFYIQNVLNKGSFLYNGSPIKFLWSLFGIDGYVAYRFSTYYICGEWFLGAIIILYLIYPAILKFYKSQKVLFLTILMLLFLFVNKYDISLQTGPFRSITSCLLSFAIGMVLIDFRKGIENIRVAFLAGIISIILLCFNNPIFTDANILVHILGTSLFILLFNMGKVIMKNHISQRIFLFISNISFPIFLLQHIIIIQVVKNFTTYIPLGKYIIIFVFTTVLIVIQSWALAQINNALLKSKVFVIIESKIIN